MSLVITKVLGLVTVQDFGRVGQMHLGLPHGGALVRELLVRANRAARNPDDAAAIEVLGRITVRAERAIEVATDAGARVLEAGEELVIESEPRRVAYLAVRGGVDAPVVLGSRSTHTSAGIGARLGAAARIVAGDAPVTERTRDAFEDAETIHVIAGPDTFPGDAIERLVSAPYQVLSTSDRVGTRLHGPALPAGAEASRPMVRGAIEVPRDGQPIVLGPEHPTTGGYPVIGVIASRDLGRFFAKRIGGLVLFALVACKGKTEPPAPTPKPIARDAAPSLDALPEAGPHPDYPTPIAAGTAKIFSLEDPDRGPPIPLTYRVSLSGLTWTSYQTCTDDNIGVICGPPLVQPTTHYWRVGRKAGLVVADKMVGSRVDERNVFTGDKKVVIDEHGLLSTMFRIANGKYSGRERNGENALKGCGSIAFKTNAEGHIIEDTCLQWLGEPMYDTRGVVTTKYKRDARGFVVEQTNFDIDGKPHADTTDVFKYLTERDDAGRRIFSRFRDVDDKPVVDTNGCYGLAFEYGANGAVASKTCLDAHDKPIPATKGVTSTAYEYDARGCSIGERYVTSDGSPAVDHDGIHGFDSTRDAFCGELSKVCIGPNNEKMTCGGGEPAKTTWKLDKNGYSISEKYFDSDGEPTSGGNMECHEIRSVWDERGHEIRQSCWGLDGTAVECDTTGFHEQRRFYDEAGRETKTQYFGTKHERVTNVGVYEHHYQYDNYDHLYETKFLDEYNGAADSYGASLRRELYDPQHRQFASLLYDADGKPAHYSGCFTGMTCPPDLIWHAVRVMRRSDGSVYANEFFDVDGQLITTVTCTGVPCLD